MKKKFELFFYLFAINAFLSCEEVDDGCNNLQNCDDYKNNPNYDGSKECIGKIVDGKIKCTLLSCEEMEDESFCYLFTPKDKNYRCLAKYYKKGEDSSKGCQLIKCSDLSTCNPFNRVMYDDSLCVEKKTYDGCELKKCTEFEASNCNKFNELKANDDYWCIKNDKNDGCEYKKCEEIKPGKCQIFQYDSIDYKCIETDDGKSCAKRSCSDYTSPNCQNFNTSNPTFLQCIEDNGRCIQTTCQNMDPQNCGKFISGDQSYECALDEINDRCKLTIRKCSELPFEKCKDYFKSIYYSIGENCIGRKDKKGCEFFKCENMNINECDKYPLDNDYNEKCEYDSESNKCIFSSCSSQDTKHCNDFIPKYKINICSNTGKKCELLQRSCDKYSIDECEDYNYFNKAFLQNEICLADQTTQKCKLAKCSDLSIDECSKLKSNDKRYQCIALGDSCSYVTCENLSSDECNKFMLDEDSEYKCIPNDDGNCILDYKDCSDLTVSSCDEFNWCTLSEDGNKCIEYESESDSGSKSNNNSNIIKLSIYGLNILILLML